MHKLLDNIDKEIDCIAEQGISNGNIGTLSTLVDIKKDITTIQAMEAEGEMRYYDENPYSYYGNGGGRYGRRYDDRYHGRDDRISERGRRIMESIDNYRYGRERYMDGDNNKKMQEGLEDVMYSVCTLVETLMDLAETSEEKEIVRKHIDKIKNI